MLKFFLYILIQAPWVLLFGTRTEKEVLGWALLVLILGILTMVGIYHVGALLLNYL